MANLSKSLEYTKVDSIGATVARLRKTYQTGKTKKIEYRLQQLRSLYWGITDHEQQLLEALKADLGKSSYESYMSEIIWCQNDVIFCQRNVEKWARDTVPEDLPLMLMPMKARLRKEPFGVGLVIGAFNFPVNLSLGPMIGAITAGNCCVLKPSEVCPNVARVLQSIIESSLDPEAYACVQGGIPETTELLNQKWDKICYTGNGTVGTIIAKKAAETLTPVILELGGQNPAIITRNADPHLAARRLAWGKVHNAGQVCISQNHVLVERDIFPMFIEEFKAALKEFYPNGVQKSPDYSRVVNERHFNRLKGLLEKSKGKILIGGGMDASDLFIEPTVVQIDSLDDELLKDEIFGPIMPVYVVDNVDQAINVANKICDTPLALYAFSKDKAETDKILDATTSGGASINDGFMHGSFGTLQFGGVGQSGTGSYRGKASFDAWTHQRPVTSTPGWVESMLAIRYPPYTGKIGQYRMSSAFRPDFDRKGRKLGWIGFLTGKTGLASDSSSKTVYGAQVNGSASAPATRPATANGPANGTANGTANGIGNGTAITPPPAAVTKN